MFWSCRMGELCARRQVFCALVSCGALCGSGAVSQEWRGLREWWGFAGLTRFRRLRRFAFSGFSAQGATRAHSPILVGGNSRLIFARCNEVFHRALLRRKTLPNTPLSLAKILRISAYILATSCLLVFLI